MNEPEHSAEVYLKRIAEDMKIIRQQMTDVTRYMREAESEVPEKMRRFIMYVHTDAGTFEKVRREMAKDTDNRWDHTRAIGAQK